MGYLDRLKNLIKYGKVAKSADNSNQFPTQQISYKGKTVEAFSLFPYGLYANMDSSDTLGLIFEVDASSDNKAFLGHTPFKRPKDLNEGEVSLYHPGTGVFIKLSSKKVEINGGGEGEVVVNTKSATINSDTTVINSTSSVVKGDLTVEGDFVNTGSASFTTNITSNGKNIGATHSHTGSPTAPSGPISPTGVPV